MRCRACTASCYQMAVTAIVAGERYSLVCFCWACSVHVLAPILSGSAVVRDSRSYSIDGTYTKSLRRVGSARGCSEASDISHRGCSEASRRRSCLRKPGGSSRMALGRAGGHVQCRARGGGGIARARSRLASSGCQGKISNHLLYRRSYT